MTYRAAAIVLMAVLGLPAIGWAQGKVDLGKREYDAKCAVCHGLKGRGDGPYAGVVIQSIPNLTVLAKNNGGVFPVQRVYELIEGERQVAAHGTSDMPIWGTRYRVEAAEKHAVDVPYDEAAYVRARMLALIDYISRLQQE